MARVIVVGAGVVGLSCAVRLLEAGHRVDVLARDLPLETTSAVAAALWYPYRARPQDLVTAWSRSTYAAFDALAAREETGVRMLSGTEVLRTRSPDPWWRAAVPVLSRVERLPAPYADGWSFVAPVIEMPVYLPWLAARVEELGGTLTRLALSALPDGPGVVVNATGLGARRTAHDPTLVPVRGQVVYVEQVGLDRWWLDAGTGAGRPPTYVVPRSEDVVVGGTDDEGEWERRADPAVARTILARAVELVPELAGARVLRHKVGLRPARPQVRLEVEDRGSTRVVHCYGHGGAGVTLSWGCADEVAGLVGPVV
jgi:D-amino-acid oxidase